MADDPHTGMATTQSLATGQHSPVHRSPQPLPGTSLNTLLAVFCWPADTSDYFFLHLAHFPHWHQMWGSMWICIPLQQAPNFTMGCAEISEDQHLLSFPQVFGHAFQEMKVKVLATHLCPTLCKPMDGSPPGSSVHVILQTRILK